VQVGFYRFCVSAVSCSEGFYTKALMFAWQVFFEQTRNILWPPPLIEEAAARSTKRRVCASRRNESPWEPQQ
ncbi:hypothetical protein, partial [Ralstonia solanacearum]|uniref:hypothetical protein n=1 Tax=Ralstonia solanacearum TaxID=305 RepID=UPI001FD7E47B